MENLPLSAFRLTSPIILVYLLALMFYVLFQLNKHKIKAVEDSLKSLDSFQGVVKNLILTSLLLVGGYYFMMDNQLGDLFPIERTFSLNVKNMAGNSLPQAACKMDVFAQVDGESRKMEMVNDSNFLFRASFPVNRNADNVIFKAVPKFTNTYVISQQYIGFKKGDRNIRGELYLKNNPQSSLPATTDELAIDSDGK